MVKPNREIVVFFEANGNNKKSEDGSVGCCIDDGVGFGGKSEGSTGTEPGVQRGG